MAAAGAILMAARLNSGSPNYGAGLELQAIAAAVIGGASLAGGRGHVLATLLGALTITIVQNGLNLNGVPSPLQSIIVGVIIVIAVGIDMWRVELGRAFGRLLPARPPPRSTRRAPDDLSALLLAHRHLGHRPRAGSRVLQKALGFYVIMPPTTIRHDDSAIGQMCDDVFGEGWGSFRIAHLSTGDGIGIELFEFRTPSVAPTTSSTGRPESSISASRIRTSRGW